MYIEQAQLSFFLAFDILLLIICITVDIGVYARDHLFEPDPSHDDFLDDDGNHSYYERSLIRKEKFLRNNPDVKESDIRNWRKLLRLFFPQKSKFPH